MRVINALILGLGMVLAALVFGLFFHSARHQESTITVVGQARKSFTADLVKWQLVLVANVEGREVAAGYAGLREDLQRVRELILAAGVPESAVSVQPMTTQPMYGNQGLITGYRLMQSLIVITEKFQAVEELALDPTGLLRQGVVIEQSQLEYYYSKVDELKRELLAEATKDARLRAEEIAGSAGAKVGAIRSARAGVFQITEPYSTEVQSYGIYNTSSREKDIRVTVHGDFELK